MLNNRDLEIWVNGHSRSFKMVPFESFSAVSYSPSMVTMALSYISSEIKPDIGRKSWFFSYSLAFGAPVRGVPVALLPSRLVWKNRMLGLPDGVKTLTICYVWLFTHNTGVWRTDRRTSCHGIVRAMHMRRAVKINKILRILQNKRVRSHTIDLYKQHADRLNEECTRDKWNGAFWRAVICHAVSNPSHRFFPMWIRENSYQ